ncbi:MAG: FtsQ-type POTRA domain-containing protein [Verrucomicrobiota bacterium]|nr:FtsQ-type POTRA domain-containing protein [Verrucomicrobiota bacterium]
MALKSRKKNKRIGQNNVLSVRVKSQQARSEQLRWLRSFLILGVTLIALVATSWLGGGLALNRLIYENESFAVSDMDFRTDGIISESQLKDWGGVKMGDNLLSLDLLRIKRNIELTPRVKMASVERFLPDTLQVRVTERVPMAQIWIWQRDSDNDGQYDCIRLQVDESGHVMPPIVGQSSVVFPQHQSEWSLPVIAGIDLKTLRTLAPGRSADLPKLQAALGVIREYRKSAMAGEVDLRVVDLSQPQILRVTTGDGGQIDLSRNRLQQQFNRWSRIRAHGQKYGLAIEAMDLSVTNNVPVRWMLSPNIAKEIRQSQKMAGK